METSDTEERLKQLLAESNFDFQNPNPRLAWTIFKDFVQEPVNCSHDGVLFECGTFNFTGENLFTFSLTRQLEIELDEEYDHMEQLHFILSRPVTNELIKVQTNLWAEGFDNLEEYFIAVEELPEFQICLQQINWTCKLEQEKI